MKRRPKCDSPKRLITRSCEMSMTADPHIYRILQFLDGDFLASVRLFHIFNTGKIAILLTTKDELYGFALDANGAYLSLNVGETLLIPALSGKKVVSLSCGSQHVLLLTEDGHVYTWGNNNYGQLGNNTMTNSTVPILCTMNLEEKKVVQVACGATFCLILTSEGELLSWGTNCYSQGLRTLNIYGEVQYGASNILYPQAIPMNNIIILITCGDYHSLALTNNGCVYSWGDNRYGQLGLGHNNAESSPCRVVALDDQCVVELACGASHSMALTHDGTIFTWGHNSNGQLGLGHRNNISTPTRINLPDVQFIQIAAARHVSSCAALTFKGEVYIWGIYDNTDYLSPTKTSLSSQHAAFSPNTWKPVEVFNGGHLVSESIKMAFDDPETSDIKFIIDGKYLYAHKTILQLRCPYFQAMFRSSWKETEDGVIQITAYTYDVFKAFLYYVYTDKLEVTQDIALSLLELSHSYCETHLTNLCEGTVIRSINTENAADLYEYAVKFDCKELKKNCVLYSMKHMRKIALTDGFDRMAGEHSKMLIRDCALNGGF